MRQNDDIKSQDDIIVEQRKNKSFNFHRLDGVTWSTFLDIRTQKMTLPCNLQSPLQKKRSSQLNWSTSRSPEMKGERSVCRRPRRFLKPFHLMTLCECHLKENATQRLFCFLAGCLALYLVSTHCTKIKWKPFIFSFLSVFIER